MSMELKILQFMALMTVITIQVIVLFKYLLPYVLKELQYSEINKSKVRVKKDKETIVEGTIYSFIPESLIVLEKKDGKLKSILLDKNMRIEEVK